MTITGVRQDEPLQANVNALGIGDASIQEFGGPRSYQLCGAFGDGKGQPAQSNAVSHGCVPGRFRQVTVINTGRAS